MRVNSYITGLGDTGDNPFSSISLDDINAINQNVDAIYGTDTAPLSAYGPNTVTNSIPTTLPTTSNQQASSGWSSLLQNIISTGVKTGAQIAVAQNAVPQLAPGTTYSYNAKTGSYVMTANNPGSASVVTTGGTSLISSPIVLLALAGLAVVFVVKKR